MKESWQTDSLKLCGREEIKSILLNLNHVIASLRVILILACYVEVVVEESNELLQDLERLKGLHDVE